MRKKKKILGAIFAMFLLIGTSVPVYAYNTFSGHTLNGGVGNYGYSMRNYWIDSSASSYTSLIDDAVSSWVHTTSRLGITTPISLSRTTTKSSSYFDVYLLAMPGSSNTVAGTYLYVKNVGCINPTLNEAITQNWSWTEIHLNSNSFPTLSDNSNLTANEKRQGTVAHEFGHAMGLAHSNNNPDVIMCQLKHDRRVYLPMADDANGINSLY